MYRCVQQQQRDEMDEVVIWSYLVLVLAVLPWLVYLVVLLFFLLSILYGSVSMHLQVSLSLSMSSQWYCH